MTSTRPGWQRSAARSTREFFRKAIFAALEQSTGDAVPDVVTLRSSTHDPQTQFTGSDESAVAVAEKPPRVDITVRADSFLSRQKRIVIRRAFGDVVALIELVSPENKRTQKSLDCLLTKVLSAIDQDLHVLVLDILPPGNHDPGGMHAAIWQELSDKPYEAPPERQLTLSSYEADDVPRAYVQPLAVGSPLPPMPVFLSPGWYVEVPLEQTHEDAWEGTPRPWRKMLTGA